MIWDLGFLLQVNRHPPQWVLKALSYYCILDGMAICEDTPAWQFCPYSKMSLYVLALAVGVLIVMGEWFSTVGIHAHSNWLLSNQQLICALHGWNSSKITCVHTVYLANNTSSTVMLVIHTLASCTKQAAVLLCVPMLSWCWSIYEKVVGNTLLGVRSK